ncbi:hypothetical protein Q8F55_003106 [Vanrija albida]|uniref:Peptidase A1 domain-containing protein n=1 Tax=Vanrija albida TaxID=181172 RepID=A0ABR3QBS1_9TREE
MGLSSMLALQFLVGLAVYELVGAALSFTFTPNIIFNYTISPLSPQFTFEAPFKLSVVNERLGQFKYQPRWNTTFSETPWSSYVPGQVGVGTARSFVTGHLDRPLSFYTIGYGAWISGTFDWRGTTPPPEGDVSRTPWFDTNYGVPALAGEKGPQLFDVSPGRNAFPMFGSNGTTLTSRDNVLVMPNATEVALELDGAVVQSGLLANVSSLDQVQTRIEYMVTKDSTLNPAFYFLGPGMNNSFLNTVDWQVSSELDGIEGQPRSPWHGQKTAIARIYRAKIGYQVPLGTSYLILNATTGPDKWWVLVTLAPEPPGTKVQVEVQMYNPWVSLENIFRAPLDPTLNYNLTIIPRTEAGNRTYIGEGIQPETPGVGAHSVELFFAGDLPKKTNTTSGADGPGSGSKEASHVGAIAGGVVGGVVVLGLVALGLWWFLRKRRNAAAAEEDPSPSADTPPEYKDDPVDQGGYTSSALAGAALTAPILNASTGATTSRGATSTTATSDTMSPTDTVGAYAPAVKRPLPVVPSAGAAVPSAGAAVPSAGAAVPSKGAAYSPSPAGPGPSASAAMVDIPQYKLDALLGVLPGDRSGQASSSIVRVPQAKVDLLAGASNAPTGRPDRVVSMPQHKLEMLLGMLPSAPGPEGSDTVLSMSQFKLDLLLAADAAGTAPPIYRA